MVRDLEVPLALARFQIDADQAVAKEIVSGAMTTVLIGGGIFDGQVDEAHFFVDRNLRPDAGVAVGRPRFVFPGVVAELARARDRVEGDRKSTRLNSSHSS